MTSRGLVALALGLAWLAGAAGQKPPDDEKDPIVANGIRLSELVKQYKSAGKDDRARVVSQLFLTYRPIPKAVVPFLVDALKDEDPSVRTAAAYLFITMGPDAKDAVPALIEALKDREGEVRVVSVDALAAMGPIAKAAVPALTAALRDESTRVRVTAARALVQLDKANAGVAMPVLRAALKSADHQMRAGAVVSLEKLGPAAVDAVPELIKLNDPGAWKALAEIGPAAVKDMTAALKSGDVLRREDTNRQYIAAFLIAVYKNRSLSDGCAAALGAAALVAADNRNTVTALPVLRAAIEDLNSGGAAVAANSDPAARDILLDLTWLLAEHKYGAHKTRPGWILGKATGAIGPAVEPALVDALKFKDIKVRLTAAALLVTKDKKAYAEAVLPVLRAGLKDNDLEMQSWAMESLWQLGPAGKDAVPELIALLAGHPDNVHMTGYTLGKIGPAAQSALVNAALHFPDGKLREEARITLKVWFPEAARKAGLR